MITLPALNLLLVDDDAEIIDFLTLVLSDGGHRVAVCSDWMQALHMVESTNPEVIFLDRQFHGIAAGEQVLDTLRASARWAAIPVIFSTADHIFLAKTTRNWRESNVILLPKPYSLSELFQALSAANDLRHMC